MYFCLNLQFSKFTDHYYNQDGKLTGLMGGREVIYMANFCAFQFWQHTFKVHNGDMIYPFFILNICVLNRLDDMYFTS